MAHKEKSVYRITTAVKGLCVCEARKRAGTNSVRDVCERVHTNTHCVCARCELGGSQACGMVL